jgi:hypothetical protein
LKAIPGVNALCPLPDGGLASGSDDNTVRLWDLKPCKDIARLEIDAPANALISTAPHRLIAGDQRGLLHWLEVRDRAPRAISSHHACFPQRRLRPAFGAGFRFKSLAGIRNCDIVSA